MSFDELVERAIGARARALAPSSGFLVGAALLGASGRIYEGCNIENRTLNLGLCAERVALVGALAAGEREFEALAIAAQWDEPVLPCGACRQLLWEFAGDVTVVTKNIGGGVETFSMSELLPRPFEFRPSQKD